MSDPGGLELVHPWPRCADPQCLSSLLDDGEKLGSDQESETEIDRGEMSDAERPFRGCHHSGTSQSALLRNASSHIISLTSSTHSGEPSRPSSRRRMAPSIAVNVTPQESGRG